MQYKVNIWLKKIIIFQSNAGPSATKKRIYESSTDSEICVASQTLEVRNNYLQ